MRYFKRKGDDAVQGTADLSTAEFVRPYDTSDECRVFEVQDGDRVFIFEAPTHKEMLRWVGVVESLREALQEKIKQEQEQLLLASKPIRLRMYDEDGEQAFVSQIQLDMDELYPPAEVLEISSIEEHLECASEVVGYLTDFVPETQKTQNFPARYDVLAMMLLMVNRTLDNRLGAVLAATEGQKLSESSEPDNHTDATTMDRDSDQSQLARARVSASTKRHELMENASLGDLHSLINWITKYQQTLRNIVCPTKKLPAHLKTPKSCSVFDALPTVCSIYVYGGTTGAKGGAAAHLFDHCNKVWERVLRSPQDLLQQHNDGYFYTEAPIGMWEAINQHISLATSTQSPILHVMLANKVVTSLNQVISNITDFVTTFNTTSSSAGNYRPELKDIELEFVSALANDTELHIRDVIELIEEFQMEEVREKIDDIFDTFTNNLVACGQACLHRLANLVMSDVQLVLDEVFTVDWLEGNQLHIATATISDYMSDFETFLKEFWSAKFVYTILEEVILRYIRSIIFRKDRPANSFRIFKVNNSIATNNSNVNGNDNGNTPKKGLFGSLFSSKKDQDSPGGNSQKSNNSASNNSKSESHICEVDDEALGRIAQDVNALNHFFAQKADQEVAAEFLNLMNEILLMMKLDLDELVVHLIKRISEFPSAAVVSTLHACTTSFVLCDVHGMIGYTLIGHI